MIHDPANDVISKQAKSGDFVPISLITNSDVRVIFDYINDSHILYILHDNKSKIDNISYDLLFIAEVKPVEEELWENFLGILHFLEL